MFKKKGRQQPPEHFYNLSLMGSLVRHIRHYMLGFPFDAPPELWLERPIPVGKVDEGDVERELENVREEEEEKKEKYAQGEELGGSEREEEIVAATTAQSTAGDICGETPTANPVENKEASTSDSPMEAKGIVTLTEEEMRDEALRRVQRKLVEEEDRLLQAEVK